ncbi:MAG TPA: thiamine pyrophosphate-dependent enzyme [Nevskiaceae bacterium]
MTRRKPETLLPTATPICFIAADGSLAARSADEVPPVAELLKAMRGLVEARRFNKLASALVRQGRLAVYPSTHGQEACQVAAVQVLDADDWLFPTYRDTTAVVARGVDPAEALTLLKGDWHTGYDPHQYKVAPQATPLGTQLTHAAGVAYAAVLRHEPTVVMALCGDGATSEGEFHAALNFAAVFRAPVVFLVQNNGYAISVPLSRQTAAPSLAYKGIGYGVPGAIVDGNDVAALLHVLGEAVRQARAGGGPQLVEALTYRMEAHTNADDATRYRDAAEVKAWEPRDPLLRLETYLRATGALTDEIMAGFVADAEAIARRTRAELNRDVTPDPTDLFQHVFDTPTPQLAAEQRMLLDELARDAEGA